MRLVYICDTSDLNVPVRQRLLNEVDPDDRDLLLPAIEMASAALENMLVYDADGDKLANIPLNKMVLLFAYGKRDVYVVRRGPSAGYTITGVIEEAVAFSRKNHAANNSKTAKFYRKLPARAQIGITCGAIMRGDPDRRLSAVGLLGEALAPLPGNAPTDIGATIDNFLANGICPVLAVLGFDLDSDNKPLSKAAALFLLPLGFCREYEGERHYDA
jgi:hypothetical protein